MPQKKAAAKKKTNKKINKTKKVVRKTKSKNKNTCQISCGCSCSKKIKPIGGVTHFFDKISVAIVKFNKAITLGEKIKFKGATTDFEQIIESMQYDHKDIKNAAKNQEVGIKVREKVREGDQIYSAE